MKVYKRFFSALLSLVIMLTFMPAMAFAEGTTPSERWDGDEMYDGLIEPGDSREVNIEKPYDYASYLFIPEETGYYIFRSTGEYDTFGRVLLEEEELAYNDDDYESTDGDENFSFEFKAEAGETYTLQAAMYGEKIGDFYVSLTYSHSDEEDEEDPGIWGGYENSGDSISAGEEAYVEIERPREYYSYEFKPIVSGYYIFRSTGNEDTYGRILDSYLEEIVDNDDVIDGDPNNYNFSIRFYAEKGETYYLEACMYSKDLGEFYVELIKDDPISIAKAKVTGVVTKNYTGRAITQKPTVELNGVTLVEGFDYKVSYLNNVKAGTAYVVITGQDRYTGTVRKAFTIRPVVPAVKFTKITKGSKSFTAKWTKASSAVQKQFTGYQIQYSANKNFLTGKFKNTTKKSASKVKINKLKKKKTYYVRIRRYLKWNGQILYSAWSPVKKIKTK